MPSALRSVTDFGVLVPAGGQLGVDLGVGALDLEPATVRPLDDGHTGFARLEHERDVAGVDVDIDGFGRGGLDDFAGFAKTLVLTGPWNDLGLDRGHDAFQLDNHVVAPSVNVLLHFLHIMAVGGISRAVSRKSSPPSELYASIPSLQLFHSSFGVFQAGPEMPGGNLPS